MRESIINLKNLTAILFLSTALVVVMSNLAHSKMKEDVVFEQSLTSHFSDPVDLVVSQEGLLYVLDRDQAMVTVFNQQYKRLYTFSRKGSDSGELNRPESIAISRNGDVVIADTGNRRIQIFTKEGDLKQILGQKGNDAGQFQYPNNVEVDPYGYIYVSDLQLHKIVRYTPQGVFLNEWKIDIRPNETAMDNQGRLYVVDNQKQRVNEYIIEEGKLLHKPFLFADMSLLNSTVGLAVDFRGDIYILENKSHSVRKFDHHANPLLSFGSEGLGRGQFHMPEAIAADHRGKIFVADSKNKRVQVMRITGSDKAFLSERTLPAPPIDFVDSLPGSMNITDIHSVPGQGVFALTSNGTLMGLYPNPDEHMPYVIHERDLDAKFPHSFHVYKDGTILLADTGSHLLKFINSNGEVIYQFGVKGEGQSEFNQLKGVAVHSSGDIFVSDTKNHRIQRFNKDGIYLNSFGSKSEYTKEGARKSTFLFPTQLVFDQEDQLYVLDSGNKRIQVFKENGVFVKQIGDKGGQVTFKDPIDIDIDAQQNIYVADRGANEIVVINDQGEKMYSFGSNGFGNAYFPSLASISVSEGKIYVGDTLLDRLYVYEVNHSNSRLEEQTNEEKIFMTKVSRKLNMNNASEEIRQAMARKLVLEDLYTSINESFHISTDEIDAIIQIESEEMMSDGQMKMTISLPKHILNDDLALLNE